MTDRDGIMKEVTAGTFRTILGNGWLNLETLSPYQSEVEQPSHLAKNDSLLGRLHGRGAPLSSVLDDVEGRTDTISLPTSSRQRTAGSSATVVSHMNPLKQWRKRVVRPAVISSRSSQDDILQADFDGKNFDPVYPARWRQTVQESVGKDADARASCERQYSTHVIKGTEHLNAANEGEWW